LRDHEQIGAFEFKNDGARGERWKILATKIATAMVSFKRLLQQGRI
jgi:hypothetical protein